MYLGPWDSALRMEENIVCGFGNSNAALCFPQGHFSTKKKKEEKQKKKKFEVLTLIADIALPQLSVR